MAMASLSNSGDQPPTALYNTRSTCMSFVVAFIVVHRPTLSLVAVKRLMREALEMKDPTELFFCQPIEVTIDM